MKKLVFILLFLLLITNVYAFSFNDKISSFSIKDVLTSFSVVDFFNKLFGIKENVVGINIESDEGIKTDIKQVGESSIVSPVSDTEQVIEQPTQQPVSDIEESIEEDGVVNIITQEPIVIEQEESDSSGTVIQQEVGDSLEDNIVEQEPEIGVGVLDEIIPLEKLPEEPIKYPNTKNMNLYSNKNVFLISDTNWKNILPLVPVTIWTDEDGNIHKYPTLIYHEEGNNVFDADSVIYFLQLYNPDIITIVGNIPQELGNLLITQQPFGAGLSEEQLETIYLNQYLNYWNNYNSIVWVQDDYKLALLASVTASYLNSPLVIGSQINPNLPVVESIEGSNSQISGSAVGNLDPVVSDPALVFQDKHVIVVGNMGCPSNAESCEYFRTIEELQQDYVERTNTDKVILLNPNDLNNYIEGEIIPLKSSYPINIFYSKSSLSAPFLASYKKEVLIPLDQEVNSSNYISVHNFLKNKINELETDVKYLTIVASPNDIPFDNSVLLTQPEIHASSVDWVYGDINEDIFKDIAVGRIFSLTPSDVSSLINRIIFYDELLNSDIFGDIWHESEFPAMLKEAISNDIILTSFGFVNESMYGNSTILSYFNYSNKFYINYFDHGWWYGWAGALNTGQLRDDYIELNNAFLIGDACSTCAFTYTMSKDDLFCSNILRHGALGYVGAVHIAGGGPNLLVDLINYNSFGNAFMNMENRIISVGPEEMHRIELGEDEGTGLYNYVLLGDPSFNLNLPPYQNPRVRVNISENNSQLKIVIDSDGINNLTMFSNLLYDNSPVLYSIPFNGPLIYNISYIKVEAFNLTQEINISSCYISIFNNSLIYTYKWVLDGQELECKDGLFLDVFNEYVEIFKIVKSFNKNYLLLGDISSVGNENNLFNYPHHIEILLEERGWE